MASIDPNKNEIEYAKKQITEANRRINTIHERISKNRTKLIADSEAASEESLELTWSGTVAESEIIDAIGAHFDEVKEVPIAEIDRELVASHIQNVIIDSQLSIELAAKSMFKLSGKDYPFTHGIAFTSGETQGFYRDIPDSFDRKDDIVRVIFLTQFWEEFYELAKYGAPQLNVGPEMIFNIDDAERAVNDAEFCVDVAEELVKYVENSSSQ